QVSTTAPTRSTETTMLRTVHAASRFCRPSWAGGTAVSVSLRTSPGPGVDRVLWLTDPSSHPRAPRGPTAARLAGRPRRAVATDEGVPHGRRAAARPSEHRAGDPGPQPRHGAGPGHRGRRPGRRTM